MTDQPLPAITDTVLDQWERSAAEDAANGRPWTVDPLAVLAVVKQLRQYRALAQADATAQRAWREHDEDCEAAAAAQRAAYRALNEIGATGEPVTCEECPVTTDDEFGLDMDPCEHPSVNGDECAACGATRRTVWDPPTEPKQGDATPTRTHHVTVPVAGIWIRRVGPHVELLAEHDGVWKLLCTELLDGPFSHIVEPGGIEHGTPTGRRQP